MQAFIKDDKLIVNTMIQEDIYVVKYITIN